MPGASYVRVIVACPSEVEDYLRLVQSLEQASDSLPCTVVMEIPATLTLDGLGGQLSDEYRAALPDGKVTLASGAGYARLCIQLVAHALQLADVWMLDDSIQDCWQLNLEAESLRKHPAQHGLLEACSFLTLMSSIEQHVAASQQHASAAQPPPEADSAFSRTSIECAWDPEQSPRMPKVEVGMTDNASGPYGFSGAHKHVAIIGFNRQPYRHKLIGAKWEGGRGPPPFKVTHSVYCFFLLNVQATCSKQPMVLWPARQFAEDIEMHHVCEDNQLSVVKCNSFFFHKANLQGSAVQQAVKQQHELPQEVTVSAPGPMWGGQQVTVTVSPGQQCRGVMVCGEASSTDLGDEQIRRYRVMPPPISNALAAYVSTPNTANTILSGRVTLNIGQSEPYSASSSFNYHGLWKWGPDTRAVPTEPGVCMCTILPPNPYEGSIRIALPTMNMGVAHHSKSVEDAQGYCYVK